MSYLVSSNSKLHQVMGEYTAPSKGDWEGVRKKLSPAVEATDSKAHTYVTLAQIVGLALGGYVALSFVRDTRLKGICPDASARMIVLGLCLAIPAGGWVWKNWDGSPNETGRLIEIKNRLGNMRSWEETSEDDKKLVEEILPQLLKEELMLLHTRKDFDGFVQRHGADVFKALPAEIKEAFDADYAVFEADKRREEAGAQYFIEILSEGKALEWDDAYALRSKSDDLKGEIVAALPNILRAEMETHTLFGIIDQLRDVVSADQFNSVMGHVKDHLENELARLQNYQAWHARFPLLHRCHPYGLGDHADAQWLADLDDVFDRVYGQSDPVEVAHERGFVGDHGYYLPRLQRDSRNPVNFAQRWGADWHEILRNLPYQQQSVRGILDEKLGDQIGQYATLAEVPDELVRATIDLGFRSALNGLYAQVLPEGDGWLEQVDLASFPPENDKGVRYQIVKRLLKEPKSNLPNELSQFESAMREIAFEQPPKLLGVYYTFGEAATSQALGPFDDAEHAVVAALVERVPEELRATAPQGDPMATLGWLCSSMLDFASHRFYALRTIDDEHEDAFENFRTGPHRQNVTGGRLSIFAKSLPVGIREPFETNIARLRGAEVVGEYAKQFGIDNFQTEYRPDPSLTQPIGYREMFVGKNIPVLDAGLLCIQPADPHTELFNAYKRVFTEADKGAAAVALFRLIGAQQDDDVARPPQSVLDWDGALPNSPYAQIELCMFAHFYVSEQIKDELYLVQGEPVTTLRNEEAVRRALYLFSKGCHQFFRIDAGRMMKTIADAELAPDNNVDVISVIDAFEAHLRQEALLEGEKNSFEGFFPPGFNFRPLFTFERSSRPNALLKQLADHIRGN